MSDKDSGVACPKAILTLESMLCFVLRSAVKKLIIQIQKECTISAPVNLSANSIIRSSRLFSFILKCAPSRFFNLGPLFFFVEAPLPGCGGWKGFVSNLWLLKSSLYHLVQTLQRVLPVALLGSKAPGLDNDLSRGVCSFPCNTQQPFPDFRSQRPGFARVETKLHGCSNLVYILASGSGRAHKLESNLIRLNSDQRSNHSAEPPKTLIDPLLPGDLLFFSQLRIPRNQPRRPGSFFETPRGLFCYDLAYTIG